MSRRPCTENSEPSPPLEELDDLLSDIESHTDTREIDEEGLIAIYELADAARKLVEHISRTLATLIHEEDER